MTPKGSVTTSSRSLLGGASNVFYPACVPLIRSFFTTISPGALLNFKLLGFLTILSLLISVLTSLEVYTTRYLTKNTPLLYTNRIIRVANTLTDTITLKIHKRRTPRNKQW